MEQFGNIVSFLADLFTVIGALLAIGITVWQSRLYIELTNNAAAISDKERAIDEIISRKNALAGTAVITQTQIDNQIKAEQKPLKRDLEKLQQQRQFIKDKLLFTKR